MATRQQMVMAGVRARIRGDGGELVVVCARRACDGARIESEATSPIDARHIAFDMRMNGYTDVEIVGAREW